MNIFRIIFVISFCFTLIESYVLIESSGDGEKVDLTIEDTYNEYDVLDQQIEMKENFEKLRNKFIQDQDAIFEETKGAVDDYKISNNINVDEIRKTIRDISSGIDLSMLKLEDQRFKIEESMEDLRDKMSSEKNENQDQMKISEVGYRNQLNTLNDRKQSLVALMTQHCDDCDEILKQYNLDIQLVKVEKAIADLEEKFLMKASEDDEKSKTAHIEKLKLMIQKYSELVDVYKKEVEERTKINDILQQSENLVNQWQECSQNIKNLLAITQSEIVDMANNLLDFQKITNRANVLMIDRIDIEPKDEETTRGSGQDDEVAYEWIKFHEKNPVIPVDAVIAGYDIDGSPLYVIRSEQTSGSYLYGKYPFTDGRKNAYVTYKYKEFGIHTFDVRKLN